MRRNTTTIRWVIMTDTDLTRYEINEHGELPVSYGRYVRWEDHVEIVAHLENEVKFALDGNDYSSGWGDGYTEGLADGRSE